MTARRILAVLGLSILLLGELVFGWLRHEIAYALARTGHEGAARAIYWTLATDGDPLALNNYAALTDRTLGEIRNRSERRRVFFEIRDMYRRAAASGLRAATLNAGLQTYRAMSKDSENLASAKEWLRQVADQGDPLIELAYARDLSFLVASPEYPERMRRLQKLADGGIAEAQEMYGRALRGTDDAAAARYFRLAAEQGHFMAIEELGFELTARARDPEALVWLQQAAEMGSIPAQNLLGDLYKTGELGPRDFAKAVYWLEMAADRTNVRQTLGDVLYFPDRAGFRCCLTVGGQMASLNGDISAAYELAELYVEGQGTPQDLKRARDLYAKASDIDWKDSRERLRDVESKLAARAQ